MPSPRTLGAAVVLMLGAFAMTACASSGPPDPAPTTNATTPAPAAPESTPTPEPEPASSEDPTCEALVGQTVVANFESVGWTVREQPFYIGSFEVEGGLYCVWTDFESAAGDHGQMFGWAEISEADATAVQEELVAQGWLREEAPEGVYITESPETAIAADENGYGMTYLFSDGTVKFSDTKQGILLIEWPAS
ncbi:hypothetical protein [Microbacterium sp. CPCC 204701]|uniref:hypothetical protein n=1 Tax=Microbacterium sp. CPCC 204701 TaxID=2493084 RepID=UPI000FDB138B|nr:hypothetical protein [Microbacterium sp. CPCC 204701]